MNKLPHIGIVAMSDTDRTDCEYAIRRAGGLPLVLETSNSQTGIDLVNKLKGVLVAISPESFPFVIELISTCLERDLPILAIGEGCLSLNRAVGGSSIDAANHINIISPKSAISLSKKKLNLSIDELAEKYKAEGMTAYSKIQQQEFAREKDGYTSVKHQREVGTSYFDAVSNTISSGKSSTTAMKGSTESEQF